MLIQWLLASAFVGFVVAVYAPDLKFTHGRWWYSYLRPVGAYTMVVSIGLLALITLNQEPWGSANPITGEQLREAGRHAWLLPLLSTAINLGPTGLGLVLLALAYWLYRHFILLR